jgi:predicted nucleic acid-binding protein
LCSSKYTQFLATLGEMAISVDSATARCALADTLQLARRFKLSSYDASYLELALRLGLPFATLDADLLRAALALGVAQV